MAKKIVVAFDFDGTITNRDTLLEFIKFAYGKKKLYKGFLRYAFIFVAMKLKIYPNWKAKQKLFAYYFKAMPLTAFDLLCKNFCIATQQQIIRPQAVETIQQHLEQGHQIIIVSASIDNWVIPFFQSFDTIQVIGTKIEVNSKGFITGNFLTKNCYGQEKVNRIKHLFPNRNLIELIAYGDSRGDREMLNYANIKHYKPFR